MAKPMYKVENWGEQINIKDKAELTEPIVNGYILYCLEGYRQL